MKKIIIFLCLFSCAGCFSGTTATVISTGAVVMPFVNPVVQGTITWQNGEAKRYYTYDRKIMHSACVNTLKKMNMPITSNSDTLIKAGNKDHFKIALEESPKNITRITVRMNFWGDKQYAWLFFHNLEDQISVIQFPKK
jgi:hypothetical protein